MSNELQTQLERALTRVCPHCKNTGSHLCPDVAEPIEVPCDHKRCVVRTLIAVACAADQARGYYALEESPSSESRTLIQALTQLRALLREDSK